LSTDCISCWYGLGEAAFDFTDVLQPTTHVLDDPGLLIKVKKQMNRDLYVGISVSPIASLGKLAMEDA